MGAIQNERRQDDYNNIIMFNRTQKLSEYLYELASSSIRTVLTRIVYTYNVIHPYVYSCSINIIVNVTCIPGLNGYDIRSLQ